MRRVISLATVLIWVLFTIAVPAYSTPSIISDWAFIDNRSENDIWGIKGLRLTIGLIATDPGGISALTGSGSEEEAMPNNVAYPYLEPIPLGLDLYNPVSGGGQFVTFPNIPKISEISNFTGTYDFTVTNTNSEDATSTSHDLDKPTVVPIPEDLSFSNFSTTPVFTFTDPNSTPSLEDLGRIYSMSIYDNTKTFLYSSAWLATPSFTVPDGILEPGMDYFFRAISADYDTTEEGGMHTRLEGRATEFETFTTAVPEPSLMVLLGISVMSLVGLRRWWKD